MSLAGLELSTEKEFTQVGFAIQTVVRALLNVKAPPLDHATSRAPIQIAAVLDRSGSMSGDKLALLKKAIRFMARQLQKSDEFSAVTFDDDVDVILRKQSLDDAGKELALRAIDKIVTGGCTNLSGGLLKGLEVLDPSPKAKPAGAGSSNEVSTKPQLVLGNTYRLIESTSGTENQEQALHQWTVYVRCNEGANGLPLIRSVQFSFDQSAVPNAPAMLLSSAPFEVSQVTADPSTVSVLVTLHDGRELALNHHLHFSGSGASASYDLPTAEQAPAASEPEAKPIVSTMVSSCLLFTDGLANKGITYSASIVAAMKETNALKAGTTVFTFGFGSDHDPSMMKALAESGKGMYYFVEKEQDIPQSFADCLGGLISVCAQDVCVRVEGLNACRVNSVQSTFPVTSNDGVHTIMIGDIYAEEERDMIVEITLPALEAAVDEVRIVQFMVTYLNVNSGRNETKEVFIALNRSQAATLPNQEVPMKLERQNLRLRTVQILETSAKMAKDGKLAAAREQVQQQQQALKEVMATRGEDAVLKGLADDLKDCENDMATPQQYMCKGEKSLRAYTHCHAMQRSAAIQGQSSPAYITCSKMEFKKAASQMKDDE
mmetsp:Transcript_23843/g.41028  ORF Transcript_23843/g.41028 Transcript_23843/m.41028 type:complete len:603 (+) Transcript_23843:78-1886(+)|eukprot:CAMPEP_0196652580 /NCGR_PEP_ID=MMETSP1086-20130531/1921_1 /TAXON_ID=77921 /ORGANISM="Cyanoptyche  gloeocystis , Strain SAG4.97" /LENGTH=602 /DNA_ID=CAMNT_0041983209 /DNA_START=77 /DNA_END=1885 /DNA_ORIENTATION=-